MSADLTELDARPPTIGVDPMRSWPPSLMSLAKSLAGAFPNAEIPAPISQTDRYWISARMARLEAWQAAGSTREELVPILAEMFAAYPAAKLAPETAKARVKAYLDALSDKPAWAIAAAAKRWVRGDVEAADGALDFPPSARRLREVAMQEMSVLYTEMSRLKTLSKAKVVPVISEVDRIARQRQVAELLGSAGQ